MSEAVGHDGQDPTQTPRPSDLDDAYADAAQAGAGDTLDDGRETAPIPIAEAAIAANAGRAALAGLHADYLLDTKGLARAGVAKGVKEAHREGDHTHNSSQHVRQRLPRRFKHIPHFISPGHPNRISRARRAEKVGEEQREKQLGSYIDALNFNANDTYQLSSEALYALTFFDDIASAPGKDMDGKEVERFITRLQLNPAVEIQAAAENLQANAGVVTKLMDSHRAWVPVAEAATRALQDRQARRNQTVDMGTAQAGTNERQIKEPVVQPPRMSTGELRDLIAEGNTMIDAYTAVLEGSVEPAQYVAQKGRDGIERLSLAKHEEVTVGLKDRIRQVDEAIDRFTKKLKEGKPGQAPETQQKLAAVRTERMRLQRRAEFVQYQIDLTDTLLAVREAELGNRLGFERAQEEATNTVGDAKVGASDRSARLRSDGTVEWVNATLNGIKGNWIVREDGAARLYLADRIVQYDPFGRVEREIPRK